MPYVYLVRHTQAEPVGSFCVGSGTDLSLTEEGARCAAGLCRCFQGMPPAPVYASPLRRSVETARLLAGPDRPIQIQDDLRELDMGCWEGKSFASIREEYPQLYTARGSDHALQPPGGESYPAAAARMERALNAIAAGLDSQEERVVVSHSGAMRAFLCKATGTPYSQNRTWSQPYGSVDVLEFGPAGWKLLAAGVSPYRCPDEG